jgi:hypothetical protein
MTFYKRVKRIKSKIKKKTKTNLLDTKETSLNSIHRDAKYNCN